MNRLDQSLLDKLRIVLLLKIVLLLSLWWIFFKGQTVAVADDNMATQLSQAASKPTQGIKR